MTVVNQSRPTSAARVDPDAEVECGQSHKPAVATSCIYLLKFICQTWPVPRQSTIMSTLYIALILGAINARRSFNEEKLVKKTSNSHH